MRARQSSGVLPSVGVARDRDPAGDNGEDALRAYHDAVASVFARHRHLGGTATCSCGGVWPCAEEEHAAWLLDWVGD